MKALLIAAAIAAGSAMADDMVARTGSDYVRITSSPCSTPEVLALLPQSLKEQFHDAITQVAGQTFRGCWARLPDGSVFLRYEDGDAGLVPYRDFRPGV